MTKVQGPEFSGN